MSDQNNDQPQEEIKSYQKDDLEKKAKAKEKSLAQIAEEREQMDKVQRFGFFSIPYPAVVGDEAYNREKQYTNHVVVDRKVITEKRGIYTMGPKWGKTGDVYFQDIEPVPAEEIERRKGLNETEYNKRISQIKQNKESKGTKIPFIPTGPHPIKGFYEFEGPSPVPTSTLYQVPNRFTHIGPDHKVLIERRGIYVNHTKLGILHPTEYFGFPFTDDELLAKYEKMSKDEKEAYEKKLKDLRIKKPDSKVPFSPASYKCEPFTNDLVTYCNYDEPTKLKYLEEYRDFKKNGRPKYKKMLPSGSAVHLGAFKPAKLCSSGRDALFNDDLYKIPRPVEEKKMEHNMSARELAEFKKKNSRVPFTYNKLMKHSTFSPSVTSNTVNLRREFPRVFSTHF